MNQKRNDGHETWHRLLEWTKQQTPAERLSGHILRIDGFTSIDPSHPLGGRDGLKDLTAIKDSKKWVAAAYFPRGQKTIENIKSKFTDDFKGVEANKAHGFIFVTNQELRLSQRELLAETCGDAPVEIYHLERISQLLDSPSAYGIRLEYLDIAMSKEDQVSYFSWLDTRNQAVITAAFQTERKLLHEDQLRRSRVALINHSVVLFPILELYRTIVWYITTPYQNRSDKGSPKVYNPDFNLSDLQDIFEPMFLYKFPMYEPAINRYVTIQRQMNDELVSLIKFVEHTEWPTLPSLCHSAIASMAQYDYSEALLGNGNMKIGQAPLRDSDIQFLKDNPQDDLVIRPGSPRNAYRALALQIKYVRPLIDEVELLIRRETST